ncbi:ester cyclase [Paenibacillus sp. RRE4]|uniref:ester cyclase n=1 Tax=Paenibacillus sp. RRE4 TaxID=2962587 RepID=UPI0028811EB9|nr:ester cyclase [Paenibacillus sp. RRE4]MDT0125400.1 ester cyclase [Paenibacillus sp. RRE4]
MIAEQVVRTFFEEVRSGRNPDYANQVMAEQVLAHQVVSEEDITVNRTPADYAAHVREMIEAYGSFTLEIQEMIAQGNKVYVRWKQSGVHTGQVDHYSPTGLPVIEIASAVYRVEEGKIVEYWIQIDRLGIEKQLERNLNA